MKYSMYAIFDRVSKSPVSQPIMAANDAIAIRGFINSNEEQRKEAEVKGVPIIAIDSLELHNLCSIDSETYKVGAPGSYVVCNGANAKEIYDDLLSKMQED